jgi:sugar/nucleoside kinase (ribokinase family)
MQILQGGSTANCAACAATLGLRTMFIGKVGDDFFGHWLIEKMQNYGVNCKVKVEKGKSTGLTFGIVFEDGKRSFISYRGTNLELSPKEINLSLVKGTRHLHHGDYWHCEKLLGEKTKKIFKEARNLGIETSLDVGWDYFGWTKDRLSLLFETLAETDVFFVNTQELERITKMKGAKGATSLLDKGPKIVAVHLGAKGSLVVSKKEVIKMPAFKVRPINPIGVGDVFNAAFIFGLIKKWNLEKVARFANAAGAVHITRVGLEYPTQQRINEFLKSIKRGL